MSRVGKCRGLRGSVTVEATWVMAVVFFTIMILLGQALRWSARTVGEFGLHEQVERKRHLTECADQKEIHESRDGAGWELEITAPVFRPERMLRLWSLAEDLT